MNCNDHRQSSALSLRSLRLCGDLWARTETNRRDAENAETAQKERVQAQKTDTKYGHSVALSVDCVKERSIRITHIKHDQA